LRVQFAQDAPISALVGAGVPEVGTYRQADTTYPAITNGWSSISAGTVHGKPRPASQRVTAMEAVTGPSTRGLAAILMTRPAEGSA
jgi:hypothetical protein